VDKLFQLSFEISIRHKWKYYNKNKNECYQNMLSYKNYFIQYVMFTNTFYKFNGIKGCFVTFM